MKFTEMIAGALEGIWVNKLRSVLTMLGMIIGVMAVIVIVTLGQSLNKQVAQAVEGMGANSFTLVPEANDNGQKGKLTLEDCKLLKSSMDSVDFVVPVKYLNYLAAIETIRKKETTLLIGTSSDYLKVDQTGLSQGRFFSEAENQMARRVVVINQTVADDLFGPGNEAVGRTLRINSLAFQVCGVTKPVASLLGAQRSNTFIPIKTLLDISDDQEIQQAIVRVKKGDQLKAATVQSVSILEMRHAVKKGYQAQTNEQMMEQFSSILTIITSVFGALAGIALLVGGIGIMNIMLVSVTERTREIGLRMAIGAQRSDILIQFLVESATIAALGGGIGSLLGIGIGAVISWILKMPIVISFGTILFAFCFSSGIGIIFGLYPANRAAKLDPIDALRYE
ncbi:ABC transporter permease [Desulfosporosinus sp. BG]|uniref:ABC transporter permease n=1 Tax=Desulfosporosinus sp. BG TaxID=1633135 RepID=UPI00083B6A39|nr:ABC transporter permease [Desulfosporosinus sp. BG]ODA42918.1 Macrolide export ATP-binding/permease protein MacB [Desulfosporosinus sp. BG]